jgi:hypothetical protein
LNRFGFADRQNRGLTALPNCLPLYPIAADSLRRPALLLIDKVALYVKTSAGVNVIWRAQVCCTLRVAGHLFVRDVRDIARAPQGMVPNP